jgi:uncharacterized membrane protein YbhN (UPF0104 family)
MDKMIWIWIAVGLALLALAQYLAVLAWLRRRREKIVFLFSGLLLPRYLNRYRDLSRREDGRTGFLFHGFIACINLALAAFLVFLFF